MKNRERTWEETRNSIEFHRIDGALWLPWLCYGPGIVTRDFELLGLSLATWGFAVLVWTPWLMFRVRMDDPLGDAAPADARLGLGLLPWVVLVVAYPWVTSKTGLLVAFPAFVTWGGGAMFMAVFRWPRLKSHGARQWLLVLGGLSYGLVALILLGALAIGFTTLPGFLFLFCLVVGGFSAFSCIRVLVAADRPPRDLKPSEDA